MAATVNRRTLRAGAGVTLLLLALGAWSARSYAQDPGVPQKPSEETKARVVSVFSVWLKARFSEAELKGLQPEDLQLESHNCGCYDEPIAHYPYPLVVLRTPRGDLVSRRDNYEGGSSFAPLAVRQGDRYCEVESEQVCFGSFAEPCDFTDFRFGPHLKPFFPTCKSQEVGWSEPLTGDYR